MKSGTRIRLSVKSIYMICYLLFPYLCAAQELIIEVETGHYQIDTINKLVIVRLTNNLPNTALSEYESVKFRLDTDEFLLSNHQTQLTTTRTYQLKKGVESYNLFLTQLPLINISTDTAILDEYKILANLSYADNEQLLNAHIGIEIRGGFSVTYPKKSYDIELWEDTSGEDNRDERFGNLRSDDDWVLDAIYNEPLRLRSYTAHKLWLNIHQAHYLDQKASAKSGTDVMYVELFLNKEYKGLYMLSEQVDRKLLQLKKYEANELKGELYKGVTWGATTFGSIPPFDNSLPSWGGYELKYPKPEDWTDWQNLYDFTDFVVNANEDNFRDEIWSKFHQGNLIDYFIFLNLLRATDNQGKNIYLAKYDQDAPYFYAPWDLDGCFGTIWDGSRRTTTDDILSNGLYDRVLQSDEGFHAKLEKRWAELRKEVLCQATLTTNIAKRFNDFASNKIYEREALVYPNYPFDAESMTYTIDWLEARILFLDHYFNYNPMLNISSSPQAYLYPNPTSDYLYLANCEDLIGSAYLITNTNGVVVQEGYFKASLNVQNLSGGLYILNIQDKNLKFFVIR